jgi:hypothetical protein
VRRAAGAKVDQHDAAAAFAQHVRGLQIAVQQSGAVQRGERRAQFDADADRFGRRERAALVQHRGQRGAVDPFAPQPRPAAVHRRAIDADDVALARARQMARFGEEARGRRAVRRGTVQLQCDVDAERRIERAVDIGRRAAGDLRAHLQVTPGEQRRRRRVAGIVDATAARGDIRDHAQRGEHARPRDDEFGRDGAFGRVAAAVDQALDRVLEGEVSRPHRS